MGGEVLPQESERGLRVVPDPVVLDGGVLGIGGIEAELHEVDIIPVPGRVQAVGGHVHDRALLLAEPVAGDEFGLHTETTLLLADRRTVVIAPAFHRGVSESRLPGKHPEIGGIEGKLLATDDATGDLGIAIVDQVPQREHRARAGDSPAAKLRRPLDLRDAVHLDNRRGIEVVVMPLRVVDLAVMRIRGGQEGHVTTRRLRR